MATARLVRLDNRRAIKRRIYAAVGPKRVRP